MTQSQLFLFTVNLKEKKWRQTDHIDGKLQGGVPGKAWLYKKYYGTALFISNMKESCVRPETVKIPRVFGLKTHIELWNWQLDNELFPSCMYMIQIDTYGWNGRSLWSIWA